MTTKKNQEFRLFDFQVDNTEYDYDGDDEKQDKKKFLIKMFAMNEKGKTCCIYVKDFNPFFYVLVSSNWSKKNTLAFKQYLKDEIGSHYENSLTDCKLVKRKKLYGFDNFKNLWSLKLSKPYNFFPLTNLQSNMEFS